MIIIGTTQLTYTKSKGDFHCPNCRQQRSFRQRRKREFLTVYFIPLIPLQLASEFLECGTCRGTFDTDVAHMTADEIRTSQRTAAIEMIRRVLVVIVAADNVVSEEELAAVRDFARQNDQPDISTDQILHEAATVRQSNMDLLQYIRYVSQQLSSEDKELLVRHAFLAATAGGELSPSRQDLLRNLPAAVDIPESRFREIVARAAEL